MGILLDTRADLSLGLSQPEEESLPTSVNPLVVKENIYSGAPDASYKHRPEPELYRDRASYGSD